jgi:Tfp pilus assembly protein PilN
MKLGKSTQAPLVVGGSPRVNLLPPEVHAERRDAVLRRRLGMAVLGVVVVTVLGVGAATLNSSAALTRYDEARDDTTSLLSQQGKYIEVRLLAQRLDELQEARQTGSATEILWRDFLDNIRLSLPGGVVMETVLVSAANPVVALAQPTAPLQGPRTVTVVFTGTSTTVPDSAAWLRGMENVTGYVDASVDSISRDDETQLYSTSITLHLDERAFSGRFGDVVAGEETAASTAEATQEEG